MYHYHIIYHLPAIHIVALKNEDKEALQKDSQNLFYFIFGVLRLIAVKCSNLISTKLFLHISTLVKALFGSDTLPQAKG